MIRSNLQAALKQAMLDRDRTRVSVLRTMLSAIDNATAVADQQPGLAIEESPIGAGASDVTGRVVSEQHAAAILEKEAQEREDAAEVYRGAGHPEHADSLDQEAGLIRSFLP